MFHIEKFEVSYKDLLEGVQDNSKPPGFKRGRPERQRQGSLMRRGSFACVSMLGHVASCRHPFSNLRVLQLSNLRVLQLSNLRVLQRKNGLSGSVVYAHVGAQGGS